MKKEKKKKRYAIAVRLDSKHFFPSFLCENISTLNHTQVSRQISWPLSLKMASFLPELQKPVFTMQQVRLLLNFAMLKY